MKLAMQMYSMWLHLLVIKNDVKRDNKTDFTRDIGTDNELNISQKSFGKKIIFSS